LSTPDPSSLPRRRRLPAAERRALILRAATEVFAERGYHGAAMEEIARRSGVSTPVVYDHFDSKVALHIHLLEQTREALLGVWRTHVGTGESAEIRVPRALEAWAAFVEDNREAVRIYYRETTGAPEVEALHRRIQEEARVALGVILGREPGAQHIAGSDDPVAMEMAAEVIRAGLTGLALWWGEHPEIPRSQVVATAVNVVWVGFERVRRGEGWRPPDPGD
jgi:AcrR family transcriptional regulator